MPLHVPSLAAKLQCLYRHHETVNTHELLAEHLGIAPNNISTWINGNEVRARELVPNRHIKRLTDLYGIPVQWLELASLEEFKMLLYASSSRDGPWHRLLAQAIESDEIRLVHLDPQVESDSQSRGLVADDKDEAVEQFRLGEHVYISIALDGEWVDHAASGHAHAVLLSVDRAKTACLCPSSLASPNPRVSPSTFLVPDSAPTRSLKVAGPVGPQRVLVLLTNGPLGCDIYAGLKQDNAEAVLDQMAMHITRTPDMLYQLFKKDYEVL